MRDLRDVLESIGRGDEAVIHSFGDGATIYVVIDDPTWRNEPQVQAYSLSERKLARADTHDIVVRVLEHLLHNGVMAWRDAYADPEDDSA